MTILENILNVLMPDYLTHAVFKLTDRFKPQHLLVLALALCTISFYAHVGQAGVGNINQVQVSNHSLVSQNAIVAEPQVLFFVLDQHLYRPPFQIVGYNGSHRSIQIISDQSYMLTFSPATREHNLDHTQLVQTTNSFGQAIFSGFAQAGNVAPLPAVSQSVSAVFAQFAFRLCLKTQF